jgi:hypothetical protein
MASSDEPYWRQPGKRNRIVLIRAGLEATLVQLYLVCTSWGDVINRKDEADPEVTRFLAVTFDLWGWPVTNN